MDNKGIHETMEALELLNIKILSLTKSSAMSFAVKDPGLKTLLEYQVTADKRDINHLQQYLQKEKDNG